MYRFVVVVVLFLYIYFVIYYKALQTRKTIKNNNNTKNHLEYESFENKFCSPCIHANSLTVRTDYSFLRIFQGCSTYSCGSFHDYFSDCLVTLISLYYPLWDSGAKI